MYAESRLRTVSIVRATLSRLRNDVGLRRILSNSGWMMGEQVFRLLVGLGVGVWIARLLGPARFGQLSYAIAFAAIFGIVATLGLNRILVRELVSTSRQHGAAGRLMSTVFAMRLIAAAAMYAICVLGAWFTGDQQLMLIGLIAGGFFFNASDCIELYFQSKVQARTTARVRLLSFSAVSCVRIALLIAEADVIAFAAIVLLEAAGAAFALQIAYRQSAGRLSASSVDWHLARKLIAESWPEIIAGFSAILFMRLDQIMLQHMAGPEAVGTFAVAARLSEVWYFIPSAIIASTFPGIVVAREKDVRQYMKGLQHLMLVLCIISYCAVLVVTVLAEPAIQILYGESYKESATILIVHIWCGLFVSLGLASGSWIMAEKKVRLNLYRNLTGLAANVALNLLMIPRLGALGSAYATLGALIVAFFVFDMFSPPMREISKRKWRALLLLPAALPAKD